MDIDQQVPGPSREGVPGVAAEAARPLRALAPDAATARRLGVRRWVLRAGLTSWLLIGVVVLAAGVFVGATALSALVIPMVAALVLAAIGAPIVGWLQRLGCPRPLGAVLVIVLLLGALVGAAALTGSVLYDNRDRLLGEVEQGIGILQERVGGLGLGESVDPLQAVRDLASRLLSGGGASAVGSGLLAGISSVGSFLIGAFLGLLLLYYLLRDTDRMVRGLALLVPAGRRDDVVALGGAATRSVRGYFRGRALLSAVTSTFMGIGVALLGIPAVPAIVVVNFIGGFVPYLGAILGGSLAVLLGLSSGGVPVALGALAVMLVANMLVEQLLEPRLVGGSLGLHPMVSLLATTAGGFIAGFFGLVLGAPLVATLVEVWGTLRKWGVFDDDDPIAGAADEPGSLDLLAEAVAFDEDEVRRKVDRPGD